MDDFINFITNYPWLLLLLVTWDMVLRGMALWKAARNEAKVWFVALLIVNSLGILPIIYLFLNRNKPVPVA